MFKTKVTLGINIAFAVQFIKQRFNVTCAITANNNMTMQCGSNGSGGLLWILMRREDVQSVTGA